MTAPSPTNADVSAERRCAACRHRWSSHDAIGTRYCTATVAIGTMRGCVCGPDTPTFDDAVTD